MNTSIIQQGSGTTRALVYLIFVGDGEPNAKHPLGTYDAIREACGPEPLIVIRGDDGTTGDLPIDDFIRARGGLHGIQRVIVGGWSAGVRGIRRYLLESERRTLQPMPALAGIIACDGLHAPWAVRDGEGRLPLGLSEVFRSRVAAARNGKPIESPCESRVAGMSSAQAYGTVVDATRDEYGGAFVLTHCMQDYMEDVIARPRYLSTHTVAKELSGFSCDPEAEHAPVPMESVRYVAGHLVVHSYASKRIDFDAHVHQQRAAMPRALKQMREWGLLVSTP